MQCNRAFKVRSRIEMYAFQLICNSGNIDRYSKFVVMSGRWVHIPVFALNQISVHSRFGPLLYSTKGS